MLNLNTYNQKIKYLLIISFIYIFSFYSHASSILDNLNVPNGFEITIFADDLNTPRQITETESGYVIVGSKKGDKIFALYDANLDGYAEKKILIANGLQNPTGVSFYKGDLYFAEIDTIWVIKILMTG